MKKYAAFLGLMLLLGVLPGASLVYTDTGTDVAYAARGAGKILGGVFAIPKAMLQDSGRVMFPFGLVTGAVDGVVDVARGGAPYAKYAALAL